MSVTKSRNLERRVNECGESLKEANVELLRLKQEVQRLESVLSEKEQQTKKKDVKIEQLRHRLEGFGVFE